MTSKNHEGRISLVLAFAVASDESLKRKQTVVPLIFYFDFHNCKIRVIKTISNLNQTNSSLKLNV